MPDTNTNGVAESKTGGTLRRVHLMIRSNWLSSAGAAIATLALLAVGTGWALQSVGTWTGPYVGIITVVLLPALFVFGLLLIPIGLLLYRKQLRQRIAVLADKPEEENPAILDTLGLGTQH